MVTDIVELLAPYPVEECKRRLEAEMNAPLSILALAEARPLIGRLRGNHLRARSRVWYRRSQTYLSAELIAEGSETRIRCRFSMHPFYKVVRIVWFSGLALIGGGALVAAIIDASLHRDVARVWPSIVIPIFMSIFGFVVAGFERHITRTDTSFLSDFITQILNARRIDPANDATGPKP